MPERERILKVTSISGKAHSSPYHSTSHHTPNKMKQSTVVVLSKIKIFWTISLNSSISWDTLPLIFIRKLEMSLSTIKCQYSYLNEEKEGRKFIREFRITAHFLMLFLFGYQKLKTEKALNYNTKFDLI